MAVESNATPAAVKEAFEQEIYSSDGTGVRFGSLFGSVDTSEPVEERVLVIFIRHFFCGNCQEYVRRLSCPESPFHPSQRLANDICANPTKNGSKPVSHPPPSVIIVGPGLPSLIRSYTDLTQCPFPVYADPSTRLYDILGMHRTLSLGNKAPEYIQRSLLSSAVKSAWQVVKRVWSGDAMGGGNWEVNGGEFLFARHDGGRVCTTHDPPKSDLPSRRSNRRTGWASGSAIHGLGWEVSWCHRMLNSRDHTELVDLQHHTCSTISPIHIHARVDSPPQSILVRGKHHVQLEIKSQGYSSQCLGSCPGPDIPRFRNEAPIDHDSPRPRSRLHGRLRSRSQTTSLRRAGTLPVPTGTTTSMRLESPASTVLFMGTQPPHTSSTIEEGEERGELPPRKSLTASTVDRVGVLVRAKSMSNRAARSGTKTPIGGIFRTASRATSLVHSRRRPQSNAGFQSDPDPDNSNISRSSSSLPSRLDTPSKARPKSSPRGHAHKRTRTFSFSKPGMNRGEVKIGDNGVMLVNGVEFINVISVKARIERVDSGIRHVDFDRSVR
ncbi:hypothetical protein A1O1_01666 [Capronia coronata CBS 617.96]|uniref:Uncharacterized protein n=1 Tax=Capronia coronata CBS 617.96 TaxID=1182541 RepID=W9ZFH6_9EURO|nr:uncharacterized protein A1O1_01666 [Capronia coronata CBS 617.96]EXJ93274.1 hypothetical protein A1O1_01666 [Capronia coronata CBS 617.96]